MSLSERDSIFGSYTDVTRDVGEGPDATRIFGTGTFTPIVLRQFGIPLDHIVRHSDIDARAVVCPAFTPPVVKVKQDPGARFPWNDFVVRVATASACEGGS